MYHSPSRMRLSSLPSPESSVLGLLLGMGPKSAKSYMSNIANGIKPMPEKYILVIINKYTEFTKKTFLKHGVKASQSFDTQKCAKY